MVKDKRQHLFSDRIKTIAEHYGFEAQKEKLIEEMAELMVAIKHLHRKDESCAEHYENFIEELGDVAIIVAELMYLLKDDREKFDRSVDFKITREMERIKGKDDEG